MQSHSSLRKSRRITEIEAGEEEFPLVTLFLYHAYALIMPPFPRLSPLCRHRKRGYELETEQWLQSAFSWHSMTFYHFLISRLRT